MSSNLFCVDFSLEFSDESKWSDNFQQQTTDSVTASNDRPTTDPATDIWGNDSLTTVVSDIWSNDSLTTTQGNSDIMMVNPVKGQTALSLKMTEILTVSPRLASNEEFDDLSKIQIDKAIANYLIAASDLSFQRKRRAKRYLTISTKKL